MALSNPFIDPINLINGMGTFAFNIGFNDLKE